MELISSLILPVKFVAAPVPKATHLLECQCWRKGRMRTVKSSSVRLQQVPFITGLPFTVWFGFGSDGFHFFSDFAIEMC